MAVSGFCRCGASNYTRAASGVGDQTLLLAGSSPAVTAFSLEPESRSQSPTDFRTPGSSSAALRPFEHAHPVWCGLERLAAVGPRCQAGARRQVGAHRRRDIPAHLKSELVPQHRLGLRVNTLTSAATSLPISRSATVAYHHPQHQDQINTCIHNTTSPSHEISSQR